MKSGDRHHIFSSVSLIFFSKVSLKPTGGVVNLVALTPPNSNVLKMSGAQVPKAYWMMDSYMKVLE